MSRWASAEILRKSGDKSADELQNGATASNHPVVAFAQDVGIEHKQKIQGADVVFPVSEELRPPPPA